jgi:SNF2-related domain
MTWSFEDREGRLAAMGYVMLDSCEFTVQTCSRKVDNKGGDSAATASNDGLPGVWHEVDLRDGEGRHTQQSEGVDEVDRQAVCRYCRVVIEATNAEETPSLHQLSTSLEHIEYFDGTLSDVCRVCPHCSRRYQCDAVTMLGLIKSCQGIVKVLRMFVLRRGMGRYALLMSIGFPHLELRSGDSKARSILPKKLSNKRTSTHVLQPLQVLLSIISSDWTRLRSTMEYMQQTVDLDANNLYGHGKSTNTVTPKASFFPTKVNLEELYQRLQSPLQASHNRPGVETSDQEQSILCRLPKELLSERIVPYLRAKSLENLRCTCTYMHDVLSSCVPGMRLNLYEHQIKALKWMRSKETKVLQESDLLHGSSNPHSCTSANVDADLHRSITGGQTVYLESSGDPTERIRLDQCTGSELKGDYVTSLHRQVARGGLLCDDPGLGKTVTVLSHILQTMGVSTKSCTGTDESVGEAEEEALAENDIFVAYWEEQTVSHTRRPALLKLVNDLSKSIKIKRFCASSVRRKIELDEYGTNFAEFEREVR